MLRKKLMNNHFPNLTLEFLTCAANFENNTIETSLTKKRLLKIRHQNSQSNELLIHCRRVIRRWLTQNSLKRESNATFL